jgi:hypothetical protein
MDAMQLSYCQFLLSSPFNYTQTYLADHVAGLSHDKVNRLLKKLDIGPQQLWEGVQETLVQHPNGYLLFDDTVLDKNHSFKIECVQKQYSGNEHRVIKGIGVVTCVYVNPETNQFWAVDYRIFDPKIDGKTKLDHVSEMLQIALQRLSFNTVLMDSWYSSRELMQEVADLGKIYYTVAKPNRLVAEHRGVHAFQRLDSLDWTDKERQEGKTIRLNDFPNDHRVQVFHVSVLPDKMEYVVTNDLRQNSQIDTRTVCKIRWKVEEFHRELKQNTGVDACQCRKSILQKNHIGCAMLVWARLKNLAYQTGQTIYQVCNSQYDAMVSLLLKHPVIVFA